MNAIENLLAYAVIGLLLLVFFLSFSIGDIIFSNTSDLVNSTITQYNSTSPLLNTVNESYDATINIFLEGVKFITYLLIGYGIFSSFVQRNSIISYFVNFGASIILGALISYFILYIYNSFITVASETSITFNYDFLMVFFFDNFAMLILANICAGILSFMWIKRELAT